MSLGRYLPRLSYVQQTLSVSEKIVPPSPGDISRAPAPTPYQAPQRPNRSLAHSGYHKCTLQHTCCMSPQIRQQRAPTIRSWSSHPLLRQIGLLNSCSAQRNVGHYSCRRTHAEPFLYTYTFLEGVLTGEASRRGSAAAPQINIRPDRQTWGETPSVTAAADVEE